MNTFYKSQKKRLPLHEKRARRAAMRKADSILCWTRTGDLVGLVTKDDTFDDIVAASEHESPDSGSISLEIKDDCAEELKVTERPEKSEAEVPAAEVNSNKTNQEPEEFQRRVQRRSTRSRTVVINPADVAEAIGQAKKGYTFNDIVANDEENSPELIKIAFETAEKPVVEEPQAKLPRKRIVTFNEALNTVHILPPEPSEEDEEVEESSELTVFYHLETSSEDEVLEVEEPLVSSTASEIIGMPVSGNDQEPSSFICEEQVVEEPLVSSTAPEIIGMPVSGNDQEPSSFICEEQVVEEPLVSSTAPEIIGTFVPGNQEASPSITKRTFSFKELLSFWNK